MDESTILVDSHCHISSPQFGEDRGEALRRARDAGVRTVIDVGTEPDGWDASLELARQHQEIRCVLGLHPNSAYEWTASVERTLRELLSRPEVVGIGETGLDYYRMGAPAEQQRQVFATHLQIARELGLPVVIHAREAYDDILDVIAQHGRDTVGVMHSFAGSSDHALRAIGLGYYISIAGPVTYKNGHAVREAAAAVPLDRLLMETDSPYLPPHPHRGKRNEPAYVALTAAAVAQTRGIGLGELARATTENARRLFRLR